MAQKTLDLRGQITVGDGVSCPTDAPSTKVQALNFACPGTFFPAVVSTDTPVPVATVGLPGLESKLLFEGVDLADVNGDGRLDLTAMNHLDAGIGMWLGDGAGAWTECEDTGLPTQRAENRGWGVTVSDLNNDGRADVTAAFGRNGSGSVEVWVQQ